MALDHSQLPIFESTVQSDSDVTPSKAWDLDATQRALDELFSLTYQYKASRSYCEPIQFVARFRSYSPFNAMLVHIQMPGAMHLAPSYRWLKVWKRTIRPGARTS